MEPDEEILAFVKDLARYAGTETYMPPNCSFEFEEGFKYGAQATKVMTGNLAKFVLIKKEIEEIKEQNDRN